MPSSSPQDSAGRPAGARWEELNAAQGNAGIDKTPAPASTVTAPPEPQNLPLDSEAGTNLVLNKATDGGLLLAQALGYQWPDELPKVFTRKDGERFVQFLEKNCQQLKGVLSDDPQRQAVSEWTKKMLGSIREAKRATVLMRWFRDPTADAGKKGIQAVSPVVFNAALTALIIAIAVVFCSMFWKN